jgi:hypothetical protein
MSLVAQPLSINELYMHVSRPDFSIGLSKLYCFVWRCWRNGEPEPKPCGPVRQNPGGIDHFLMAVLVSHDPEPTPTVRRSIRDQVDFVHGSEHPGPQRNHVKDRYSITSSARNKDRLGHGQAEPPWRP